MSDDTLVVRPARVKMALLMAFLLLCLVLVFTEIWDRRPSLYSGLLFDGLGILQLAFVVILIALALICMVGMFSPFPIFSVSNAGIRTYSMFGLFGSELTPWPEVTLIEIELSGGPRSLTIYSAPKPDSYCLMRWLIRKTKGPGRVRVSVMRGMTAGLFDTMVDQLLERYEHEINEYGIRVLVRGDE